MKDPNDTNTPRPEDSGGEEPILRDERLTAYLFGETDELTPDEREAIARETESSGPRREELDLLRRTVEAVRAAAPRAGALDPERRAALLRAASEERPAGAVSSKPASRPRGGKIWLFLTPVAAAAAVLIVLGPLMNSGSSPGDGTELADATEVGDPEDSFEDSVENESAFPKSKTRGSKKAEAPAAASAPGEQRGGAGGSTEVGATASPESESATAERTTNKRTYASTSKVRDRNARGEELARTRELERLSKAAATGGRPSAGREVTDEVRPGNAGAGAHGQPFGRGSLVREGGTAEEERRATPELPEVRVEARRKPASPERQRQIVESLRLADAEQKALRESAAEPVRELEELRQNAVESRSRFRQERVLDFAYEADKKAQAPESLFKNRPPAPVEALEERVEHAAKEPAPVGGASDVTELEREVKERPALALREKTAESLAPESKAESSNTSTRAGEADALDTKNRSPQAAAEEAEEASVLAASDGAAAGEKRDEAPPGEAASPASSAATSTRRRASSRTVVDPRVAVDEILSRLDRREGETPEMMFFRYFRDNPFVDTRNDNLSTFGLDVDTASYTLFRSYLYKRGVLPPKEAIRTEEFVNYFTTGYEPPEDGADFAIHTEVAPAPFAHRPEYRLLKVGIKAREVERAERKPCALTFVIDTSGSMRRENRLELVKDALGLLVPELDEGDQVGIVAFDREVRRILEPTPASEGERILDAIDSLHPRRNTNVDAGLREGYSMAAEHLVPDANNRVILLSDGVANTGVTDAERMLERTREHRRRGIFLSCIGVGMGNHNDALLEQLADDGDGQCIYVDRIEEARRAFVDNLTATLEAVARDARVQVELDPEKVSRYRLLGYENRDIADNRFRDKTVDAGEVGAGHEVVALYEIRPAAEEIAEETEGPLATVRLRYKAIENDEEIELEHAVEGLSYESFSDAPPRYRLSALVAEFAEVLRESYWARGQSLERVASLTEELLGEGEGRLGTDPQVVELVALMKKADALVRRRDARRSEGEEIVDALKENLYLEARIEKTAAARRAEDRRHLEELREQNAALRNRLEGLFESAR